MKNMNLYISGAIFIGCLVIFMINIALFITTVNLEIVIGNGFDSSDSILQMCYIMGFILIIDFLIFISNLKGALHER